MRRRMMMGGEGHHGLVVHGEPKNIGDILLSNKSGTEVWYVTYNEYNETDYPIAEYIPQSIVINIDNRIGVSLVWMSCKTPEIGTIATNEIIYFGQYGSIPTGSSTKNINDKLLDMATAQPNWMTDATITNNNSVGYSPAACCCARYKTESLNKWYLPNSTFLNYLIEGKQINSSINRSIAKLKNAGNRCCEITNFTVIFSCTRMNTTRLYGITGSGLTDVQASSQRHIRSVCYLP